MSTLHLRGYRPAPGERAFRSYTGRFGTRWCWEGAWAAVRYDDDAEDEQLDRLTEACLAARDTPDPLVIRYVDRWAALGRRHVLPATRGS